MQGNSNQDTLQAIEDDLLATYGCLLPSGEVTVPLVLPWTKKGVLGELNRQGKILAWNLDKEYEELSGELENSTGQKRAKIIKR